MNETTNLARKVLDLLEPDRTKQSRWLEQKALCAPSQAECALDFSDRLEMAKELKEKVFVFGDYDADGILATTILCLLLESLGIEYGFYIPDRIREGYGLNEKTAALAAEKGYGLLITVDNGVKAHEAIALAKEKGMDVIVTDHHTMNEPVQADLVVHPSLMEEPFAHLCGAGIVYELARVMQKDTDYQLMLAAVASIGDVMRVEEETRAIIQQGLRLIKEKGEYHLERLCDLKDLNEQDIAFRIVPAINAIGRMANICNANNAVRYFLVNTPHSIEKLSTQMLQINEQRKRLSSSMTQFAQTKVSAAEDVLFIMDPGFHEGIIGLSAGALCEQHGKPVIMMTQTGVGMKASMRAPAGFNCIEFLKDFDKFQTCGGHKQAAGFSLDLVDLDAFKDYLFKKSRSYEWQPEQKKYLDIEPAQISIEEIAGLDVLRPFGSGFELPAFRLKNPSIQKIADLQMGKHRRYLLENDIEAIRFNQTDRERSTSVLNIDSFIGSLQISRFQGRRKANFIINEIIYK